MQRSFAKLRMTPLRVILASRSRARKKLFAKLGIPFECHTSRYVEDMNAYKTPKRLALFLALQKARFCAPSFPSSIIIGADTFITVGVAKIGKPSSRADAKRIIRTMSGKTLKVHSGVAVITTDKKGAIIRERSDYDVTFLKIKKMSEREIARLASQKNALKISGAFSIEGEGGNMIESISGDYDTVIGLPLAKLEPLLHRKRSLPSKDYLKRCKYSSPESKLEWLASAVEFAFAKKKRL